MNYPYRTEEEQSILEHMPHSPYASDDHPFLATQRYSMSGYDPREVDDKSRLDTQGVYDNRYWYSLNKGQRGEML